jgi:hypothetical protein
VDGQSETYEWAKAGVVLRNDIAGSGRSPGYAIMVLTPGHGVSFQWDSDGNGFLDSVASSDPGVLPPVWVRLTRVGTDRVSASYSRDGRAWTQVGSAVTVPGAAAAQDAGVIMCSCNASVKGTVVFTGLRVTTP